MGELLDIAGFSNTFQGVIGEESSSEVYYFEGLTDFGIEIFDHSFVVDIDAFDDFEHFKVVEMLGLCNGEHRSVTKQSPADVQLLKMHHILTLQKLFEKCLINRAALQRKNFDVFEVFAGAHRFKTVFEKRVGDCDVGDVHAVLGGEEGREIGF